MRINVHFARVGLIGALFFTCVLAAPLAHAVDELHDAIAITPTSKHYSVKAGDHVTDSLTIVNPGDTIINFKVYARPFFVKSGTYETVFSQESDYADGYRWLTLPLTTYSIAPKQKVSVPFDMYVSKGARSGGHYAAIFAETQAPQVEGQTGVANNKSVGMLMYINVEGSTKTAGAFTGIDMPWYQPAAPLKSVPHLENTGETDFSAKVTFAVMDIAGDVKYQTNGDYWMLPHTTRDITFTWDKSPWFGLYKVRVSTTVLDKTSVTESYIIIAPRWLVFVACLVIILGVIDVVRRKRTTTKHKSH